MPQSSLWCSGPILHVPVSLELSRANFLRLTAMYLVSALPFLLTGVAFSVIFARESAHIARMYGADLCGGAAACLAVVPLLNWLGGPNAILFAGFMAATAGLIWAPYGNARKLAIGFGATPACADRRQPLWTPDRCDLRQGRFP